MMFIKVFDRLRVLHGIFIILFIIKNPNISFLLKVYIIEYILLHIMYYTIDEGSGTYHCNTSLGIWNNSINSISLSYEIPHFWINHSFLDMSLISGRE